MEKEAISQQDLRIINSKLDNIQTALLAGKTVLTFDDVVSYTGFSKSYLYKLTSGGIIPHSKPNGKNIYFDKAAIDSWLLRNQIKTHEEIEVDAASYVTFKKGLARAGNKRGKNSQ